MKTSLIATASAAGLSLRGVAASTAGPREFYELRCYHLQADHRIAADADPALLDGYLAQAFLPALTAKGVKPVGVFSEIEVDKATVTSSPQVGSPIWVLIPYPSLDQFVAVSADINTDPVVQAAAADYLLAPKSAPAFARVDSWVLRAFAGMPQMEIPEFSRQRVPTRVIEMRDYESHSEERALAKMAMFDEGETQLMRDLGMHPMFFGQALSGPNLPHLRYFTSGPDLATHLASWSKFGPDPRWTKMKNDPRYADSTSLNTSRFLAPKPYSQI